MKDKITTPWYVLSCLPVAKTSGIGKDIMHGWVWKGCTTLLAPLNTLTVQTSVFGTHDICQKNKGWNDIYYKTSSRQIRILGIREIKLPSLPSPRYKNWEECSDFQFLCKHRVSDLIFIYTPAQVLPNLEIYKMPKGYIIDMIKAADYKPYTSHWLYNLMFSFSQLSWSGGLYKYSSRENCDGRAICYFRDVKAPSPKYTAITSLGPLLACGFCRRSRNGTQLGKGQRQQTSRVFLRTLKKSCCCSGSC